MRKFKCRQNVQKAKIHTTVSEAQFSTKSYKTKRAVVHKPLPVLEVEFFIKTDQIYVFDELAICPFFFVSIFIK